MNVVERIPAEGQAVTASNEVKAAEPAMAPSAEAKPRRPGLRPLLALAPYVARYRGRAFGALVALIVASLATLAVPLAVRRMIDFGFSPESVAMINS